MVYASELVMKTTKFLLPVAAALLLAGCSTPATRIRDHPAIFSSLTPAQQDLIRHGQIAIGFTKEMVELALGNPDHITTRTDANGVTQIWRYTTYETPDGFPLYTGWYQRYYCWGDPLFPYYLDYPYRRERDHYRVTFKSGKVSAIEERN